jgi:hypothetical protein
MVVSSLLLLNGYSGGSVAVSAKKGDDQEIQLLSALATLYQNHQITPDFYMLYSQRKTSTPFITTAIPTYPFQRVRCYPSYIPSRRDNGSGKVPIPGGPGNNTAQRDPVSEPTLNVDSEQLRKLLTTCIRDVLEIPEGEDLGQKFFFGDMSLSLIVIQTIRNLSSSMASTRLCLPTCGNGLGSVLGLICLFYSGRTHSPLKL